MATDNLVTFRQPTGPFAMTSRELELAASLCEARGAGWRAEALPADDGAVGLGLVTPSSVRDGGAPDFAWLIEPTAKGLALVDAPTWEAVGVFRTLHAAFTVVEQIEQRRAALIGPSAFGKAPAEGPANDNVTT